MNRQDATGAPFKERKTGGQVEEPSPEVDALARSVIDAAGEGRLDILVAGKLPVELKAVEALAPIHKAQVISYLKATGLQLGLLINFNVSTYPSSAPAFSELFCHTLATEPSNPSRPYGSLDARAIPRWRLPPR